MIKRVIEVNSARYLHLKLGQLLLRDGETLVAQIPLEDLGVLVLAHPQITLSHALLTALSTHNVAVLSCDQRQLPVGLLQPLAKHSLHTKVLRQQIALGQSRQKRLWQCIVQYKIQQQARTVREFNGSDTGLLALAKRVKTGDSQNHEAQAAQRYWPQLMGKGFTRNTKAEGINAALNYGYAVLRAAVARALSGTGLHLALGLNHSNQYNAFCLADDVMEPFRPWVDACVLRHYSDAEGLDTVFKHKLLSVLTWQVTFADKTQPFLVAMGLLAADIKRCYTDKNLVLQYPTRIYAGLHE